MANEIDDFADFLNQAIRDMLCNDFPDYCNDERKDYAIPDEIVQSAKCELPGFNYPEDNCDFGDVRINDSEYISNRAQISDLFSNPVILNGGLTKMLILHRLALIDLFYGTNVNRMRQFGLMEIA